MQKGTQNEGTTQKLVIKKRNAPIVRAPTDADRKAQQTQDPIRRIQYILVPVGKTRSLAQPVFDIKLTDVSPCTEVENVAVKTPELTHRTTDTLVIQWKVDTWADRQRVKKYDVQIRQPALKKDQRLQMFGFESHDSNEDSKERTSEVNPAFPASHLEFFCDRNFTSVPNKAIRHFDTRSELIITSLPGGCDPLIVRVRAMVEKSKWEDTKKGGWGHWSDESSPMTTLSTVCNALNPWAEKAFAHALKLTWATSINDQYGKISNYRLLGRCHVQGREDVATNLSVEDRNSQLLAVRPMRSPSHDDRESLPFEVPLTPKSPVMKKNTGWEDEGVEVDVDAETGWICLYDGMQTSFTIGETPYGASVGVDDRARLERVAAHRLLRIFQKKTFFADQDDTFHRFLDHSTKYDFRVEALCHAWFRGTLRESILKSSVVEISTLSPVPDPPQAPFVMQYHGLISASSISLTWRPPATYGSGYSSKRYDKSVRQHGVPQRELKGTKERLKDEGWKQIVDETSGSVLWVHQDTGEQRYNQPEAIGLGRIEYKLYGRQIAPKSNLLSKFTLIYEGRSCHHDAGSSTSQFPIVANTTYEFALSATNEVGTSLRGSSFEYLLQIQVWVSA